MSERGYTTRLVEAFAAFLAESIPSLTWDEALVYPAGTSWPIYISLAPSEPDELITLTPYPVSVGIDQGADVWGIQVLVRGTEDVRSATDASDSIFDAVHGATYPDFDGLAVSQIRSLNTAPPDRDERGRAQVLSNFHLNVDRITTNRDY